MTDIIIIGGGPAGLSAAIYAQRAGFSVQILDKGASGAQITQATEVENYLGFPSISGVELHSKFVEHVKALNIPTVKKGVVAVDKQENGFLVKTKKDEFECKYLVLAMGRSHRHLGVAGEEELAGAGVSYCATCDGYFFKDKTVAVVGGGDSALTQAIYLSGICKKVYLIHRRDSFRAAKYLINKASEIENIQFVLNSTVDKILGESFVTGISVVTENTVHEIDCDGVFGAIGEEPNISFTIDGLELGNQGHIVTDNFCRTNINGLYAVGDLRDREVYQIISAVADAPLLIEGILKDSKK